jgi:double-stranded uracil-DNA glycosylase
METLPDYIDEDVEILAVGLNPSPNSVRCGYPFATRQNRFWRALDLSLLVTDRFPPGVESMRRLLVDEHIGFTDVVKRPTAGASDLRVQDYRRWAPVLREKIERVRPRTVWFQGKVAYRNFARYGLGISACGVDWGRQDMSCDGAAMFVTPNPSPANAAYSLRDITEWFDRLAEFTQRA